MEKLLFEKTGNSAIVTLNRPRIYNAIDWDMSRQLVDFLEDIEEDKAISMVLLRAAGDNFCSGADVKEVNEKGLGSNREYVHASGEVFSTIAKSNKIVICKIQGIASGFGLGLAAASDLVIAAENAVFFLPEITFQIFPTVVIVPIINRIGKNHALELAITAKRIGALEAKDIGLVTQVVPLSDLENATDELMEVIGSRSVDALRLGKEFVNAIGDEKYTRKMSYGCDMFLIGAMTRGDWK